MKERFGVIPITITTSVAGKCTKAIGITTIMTGVMTAITTIIRQNGNLPTEGCQKQALMRTK